MVTYARTDGYGNVLSWPLTEAQKANTGLPDRFFERILPRGPAAYDSRTHDVREVAPARDGGGALVQNWETVQRPEEEVRTARLELLANLRWQRQVGGIEVGGVPVRTDEKTRNEISAATLAVAQGNMTSVRWKLGTGQWITLSDAQIAGIASAVTAHNQACFQAESDVSDMMEAAQDVPALLAIDISTEFETAYSAAMQAAMNPT